MTNLSRKGVTVKASRSSNVAKKCQTVDEQSLKTCSCEIEAVTETLEPSRISVVTGTVVAPNSYQPLHVTSEVSDESVANDKSITQTCLPSKRRRTDVGSQRIYASRRRSNAAPLVGESPRCCPPNRHIAPHPASQVATCSQPRRREDG